MMDLRFPFFQPNLSPTEPGLARLVIRSIINSHSEQIQVSKAAYDLPKSASRFLQQPYLPLAKMIAVRSTRILRSRLSSWTVGLVFLGVTRSHSSLLERTARRSWRREK